MDTDEYGNSKLPPSVDRDERETKTPAGNRQTYSGSNKKFIFLIKSMCTYYRFSNQYSYLIPLKNIIMPYLDFSPIGPVHINMIK